MLQVGTHNITRPGEEGRRVTGYPANTGAWFDGLTVRSCGCMRLYLVTALCLADFSSFWSLVRIKIARLARTSNSCQGACACTHMCPYVSFVPLCLVISALDGPELSSHFCRKISAVLDSYEVTFFFFFY